jgi:hypothetical protein
VPQRFKPDWMARVDGRYGPIKKLRARYGELESDLGGAEALCTTQKMVAARLVHAEAVCEQFERKIQTGQELDLALYSQMLDRVVRCAQVLGLERRARTLDLGSALAETVAPAHRSADEEQD